MVPACFVPLVAVWWWRDLGASDNHSHVMDDAEVAPLCDKFSGSFIKNTHGRNAHTLVKTEVRRPTRRDAPFCDQWCHKVLAGGQAVKKKM